jgi:ArsR family transcriptional regulator, arsenate/arsenite/antimonite-responsive transcriptional repressor
MRQLTKVFKALSDETRLRILNILHERDCCVCEVMHALDISQTRASRNLNALYQAGFLNVKRDGLWVVYSIDKDSLKEYYHELIEIIVSSLKGNSISNLDRERLKTATRTGIVCCTTTSVQ